MVRGSRVRFVAATLACIATALASAGVSGGQPSTAALARTWHVAPEELKGVPPAIQLRTISAAAEKAEPGDTVVIHSGVYREAVTVETSGTKEKPIRFEAAPGENVVITGADAIRNWKKEPGAGSIFSAPWPHRFIGWNKSGTHPDDDEHRMIGRCEQVFILGYPLLQVLDRSQLGRGTFYVDLVAHRLYVCPRDGAHLSIDDPPLVEASARQVLWHGKGQFIHVRGLTFRYAANMAQQGAARFEGDNGIIEDCTFESTNSSGATFAASGLIVRRCVFRDNGQLGFGAARAHDMVLSDCVVRDNNVKGFSRGWEAGGDKLVLCRNVVIERCQFISNRGNGLWFDIGNEKPVVRNCLIADNDDAGIFYEISYGLYAHDNVIAGNGFRETPGSWGAGAGISLSSSPDCVIERNLIVGNREGFNFREQGRKTPLIDDERERWIWNHDERISHNVFALNRDAQVWGWFDVDDGRHWPAALQVAGEQQKGRVAARDVAAGYQAKDRAGAPVGLTLETLNITFDNNLYDARPWQGLFHWGVDWKRHKKYTSLGDVRAELRFESDGSAGEFQIENYVGRDFRMPPGSAALKAGCYPRGEIPGAKLGVR
jgi:Right handed beta helix region/Chondroitinase B